MQFDVKYKFLVVALFCFGSVGSGISSYSEDEEGRYPRNPEWTRMYELEKLRKEKASHKLRMIILDKRQMNPDIWRVLYLPPVSAFAFCNVIDEKIKESICKQLKRTNSF